MNQEKGTSVQKPDPRAVWLNIVLLVCLCLMIGVYLWGLNRGFDLIDEGDFLLSSTNPRAYPQPSSYAFFMAAMPSLLPDKLHSFRLASLIASLSSITVLTFSFAKWFCSVSQWHSKRFEIGSIALATVMSSLLFSTIFAPTISYNVMAAFSLEVSCAMLFWNFYRLNTNEYRSNGSDKAKFGAPNMVTAGFFAGICVFVKFTSAIVFFTLSCVAILLLSRTRRLVQLANYVVGNILAWTGYFLLVENPENCLQRLRTTVLELEISARSSHSISTVFANTLVSTLRHGQELAFVLITLIVYFLVFRFAQNRYASILNLVPTITLVGLLLVWTWRGFTHGTFHSSVVYFPAFFVGMHLVSFIARTKFELPLQKRTIQIVFGLGLIALLPFILSFGTNSPLFWHAIGNIAPLFLALALASSLIGIKSGSQAIPLVSITLIAFVSAFQFVNGFVIHSRNGSNLLNNYTNVAIPSRLVHTKLTPELANFVSRSFDILSKNGFEEGDPVLAFYDLPGLVWAVGASSPEYSRYGVPFAKQNEFFLSRLQKRNWKRFYLVISNRSEFRDPNPDVVEHLKAAGLEYPTRFRLIGTVFRPNVYWHGGTRAFIYALER